MDKKEIAAILQEMGTLLELQGANPFKSRAFQNASRAMEGVTQDLQALVTSGGLLEIKGIGTSIAAIVTDLVNSGKSAEYDALRKQFPSGVLEMLRIQGLGPKKVKVLYEKLKINSLEKLEQAAKKGVLESVDGFGKKSQENILKGIEALRSRSDKSLYPAAYEPAQQMYEHLLKQHGVLRAEVAGSLRRHKEVIGDIDILVSAKDTHRSALMEAFTGWQGVEAVVAKGETKSTVLLAKGISCDLRIVSDQEFPFALNYFTGSKEHNVEMRARANRYGWSLNEYGFSKIGGEEKRGKAKQVVPCRTEVDIYKALDLAFIPPELRENMGEIEAAERGTLPHLVEEKDIRGTFHCHTTYSDGLSTLQQMVDAARSLGWEYLGIADHSKAAAYAGGLTEEKLKSQIRDIDRLNESLKGFRIFKGTECDILPNGDLDWTNKLLAALDYVVISIHSNFTMKKAEMTKRIVKALKNPYVTMLGHPTGRLLLARDEYAVDMIQVIDAASDYGKMIEINAHPMRLDLDWRLCKYAKEKGVLIPINPDAHNVEGLHDVHYGVGTARKGWLEKSDIPNTMSTREVEKTFALIGRGQRK
jgi:DNA polymerase (family 10)